MKKIIAKSLLILAFIGFIAAPTIALSTPVVSSASAACDDSLLGIPPWYRGLTTGTDCQVQNPNDAGGLSTFIWKIVLNIIAMALAVTAYIAAFFILYGGFLFMTLGSTPEGVVKARRTMLNAVIGLVIAMSAIALMELVFRIVK